VLLLLLLHNIPHLLMLHTMLYLLSYCCGITAHMLSHAQVYDC
jgi:hypothetical protein